MGQAGSAPTLEEPTQQPRTQRSQSTPNISISRRSPSTSVASGSTSTSRTPNRVTASGHSKPSRSANAHRRASEEALNGKRRNSAPLVVRERAPDEQEILEGLRIGVGKGKRLSREDGPVLVPDSHGSKDPTHEHYKLVAAAARRAARTPMVMRPTPPSPAKIPIFESPPSTPPMEREMLRRASTTSRWSMSSESNGPKPLLPGTTFRNSFVPPTSHDATVSSRNSRRISRQSAVIPGSPASSRSNKSFSRGILRLATPNSKKASIKKSKIVVVGAQRMSAGRYAAIVKSAQNSVEAAKVDSPAVVAIIVKPIVIRPVSRGSRGSIGHTTPTLGGARRGSGNAAGERRRSSASERRGSASTSGSRKNSLKSGHASTLVQPEEPVPTPVEAKEIRSVVTRPLSPPTSLDNLLATQEEGPWVDDLDTPPPTPSKLERSQRSSPASESISTSSTTPTKAPLFVPAPVAPQPHRASSITRLPTGHPANHHARFRKITPLPLLPSAVPLHPRSESLPYNSLYPSETSQSTDAILSRELRSLSEPAPRFLPLRRPSVANPLPSLRSLPERECEVEDSSSDPRRFSEPSAGFRSQSPADAMRRQSLQANRHVRGHSSQYLADGLRISTSPSEESILSTRLSFPRSVSFASPTASPAYEPRRKGSEVSLFNLSVTHEQNSYTAPSSLLASRQQRASEGSYFPHQPSSQPPLVRPISSSSNHPTSQWEGYNMSRPSRHTTKLSPAPEIAPECSVEGYAQAMSSSLWSSIDRPLPTPDDEPPPHVESDYHQQPPRAYGRNTSLPSLESPSSSVESTPSSTCFSSFGSLDYKSAPHSRKSSLQKHQIQEPKVVQVQLNSEKLTFRRPTLAYAELEKEFPTRGSRWSFLKDEDLFNFDD